MLFPKFQKIKERSGRLNLVLGPKRIWKIYKVDVYKLDNVYLLHLEKAEIGIQGRVLIVQRTGESIKYIISTTLKASASIAALSNVGTSNSGIESFILKILGPC